MQMRCRESNSNFSWLLSARPVRVASLRESPIPSQDIVKTHVILACTHQPFPHIRIGHFYFPPGLFAPLRFANGPVAELVGIEGGVVSGVFNLESSDVGASDRRPRHEENYHEV